MLFAGMAMGQMKVFSDGTTAVGETSVSNGNEMQIRGNNPTFSVDGLAGSTAANFEMTTPTAAWRFFLNAGGAMNIRDQANGNNVFRFDAGAPAGAFRMIDSGDIGIGSANPSERLHVNGNIFATGTITPSDSRLKTLEKSDNLPGLDAVLQMNVVKFRYNGKAGISSKESHIGVVAQELQEIAPALVGNYTHKEFSDNDELTVDEEYLSIRDSEIKYMLVNAIKEQQVIIEDLQVQIADLQSTIGSVDDTNTVNDVDLVDVAQSTLGQNSPNPYNEGTVISYSVADNASSAKMNFYNLTGQLIKSVSLQNGAGKVNVSADELPSGTYTYSLEVDGVLISNKKMVKMR